MTGVGAADRPALAAYDGAAGTLVDTNVWIDCIDAGSPWHARATDHLQACAESAPLHVNIVVYAELLLPNVAADAVEAMFDVFETRRTALPWDCSALSAAAFARFRRRGESERSRCTTSSSAPTPPCPTQRADARPTRLRSPFPAPAHDLACAAVTFSRAAVWPWRRRVVRRSERAPAVRKVVTARAGKSRRQVRI